MADEAINIPIEYTAKTGNVSKALNDLSKKTKDAINAGNVKDSNMAKLQTQIAKANADLENTAKKLKSLEVPTEEFEKLQQDIAQTSDTVKEYDVAWEHANANLIESKQRLSEIRTQIDNLKGQKNVLIDTVGDKDNLKAQLQSQLADLRTQKSQIEQALKISPDESTTKELQTQWESINTKMQSVRHELLSTSASFGNLKRSAEPQIASLTEQINKLKTEESAQIDVVNSNAQAYAKAKANIELTQNALEELKDTVATMKSEGTDTMIPEDSQAKAQVYIAQINELNQKIEELENKRSKMQEQPATPNTEGIKKTGNDTKEAEKKANEAEKAYKKFAKTLGSVASQAAKATGKLLSLPLKTVGKAISNVHSKMKNLQKMLGRMIIRKVFNLALQAIIKFAKESVQELAKFSGSFNKSISEMMSSFQYLGRNLVSAIAPLLEAITPLVTEFVDKITEAVIKVNSFFSAVTGKKQMVVAKKQQFDYAKSLEETAKAAEEASKQLGYYDKLNVIGQDNKDSGISQESPFSYQNLDTQSAISDFAKKVKEAWKKADFTEVATILTNKFTGVLNKFNTDIVPKIRDFATRLGASIRTFVNGVFANESMWSQLGVALGNIVNIITDFAYQISMIDWKQMGTSIGIAISDMIRTIDWKKVTSTILNLLLALPKIIIGLLEGIDWDAVGDAIWDIIITIIEYLPEMLATASELAGALLGASIKLVISLIENIATAIGEADWGEVWEKLKETAVNMVDGFFEGLLSALSGTSIGEWIRVNIYEPFITWLKDLFGISSPSKVMEEQGNFIMQGLLNGISSFVGKIVNKFTELKDKIVTKISELKTKAVNKFKEIKTGILNVWDSIKSGIKSAVNWILGKIENFINGMISAINWFTSKVNNVTGLLPDWAGGSKLQIRQIGYVQIPRLAQGAVIPPNREFLAMLGDQKKGYNIETPLDTMIEAFETALDNRGNEGTSTIILQLDRREVARIVYDSMEKKYKQTGRFIKGVEV